MTVFHRKKWHKKCHKFLFYCASSMFFRNNRDMKNPHNQRFLPWLWGFSMVEAGRVELPSERTFPRLSTSVVYRLSSAAGERQTNPRPL